MTTSGQLRCNIAAIALLVAAPVFSCNTVRAQESGAKSAATPNDTRPIINNFDCTKTHAPIVANVIWKSDDGAIKWGEWRVRVGENKLPVVVIVAVVATKRTQISLDVAKDGEKLGAWSLSKAGASARFAVNAGQFTDDGPWGWVIHRGHEQQRPGAGALAGALIVDTSGTWSLLDANEISQRRMTLSVREAVQSYPTLIDHSGNIPKSFCADNKEIDLTHRDTRLVVGTLPLGQLILAMTRFDGLGEAAERLPIGPTSPEMVEIMRALGATRALMLDGGLSAQMLIRTANSATAREWSGLRGVPLALVGVPTLLPPPPSR